MVEACRVLSNSVGFHPSQLAYYTNIVIIDRSEETDVWQADALELAILALMHFFIVVERGAVGYACHDFYMGHGKGDVIAPLLRDA